MLPVSSLLTDYRGISNVCQSVPLMEDRRGVNGLLLAKSTNADALPQGL